MRDVTFAGLLLACVLFSVSGCSDRGSATENAKTHHSSGSPNDVETRSEGFPVTITDRLGRKRTFDRAPKRIISLSPRNTELLFAVGAGDRVVGVTTYCDFPPEAAKRQKVGGFSGSSLSIETIVSLKPDLVVSGGAVHGSVIDQLQRLQIPVVALESDSFENLYRDIRLLGRITECDEQATHLVQTMRQRVAAVEQAVRGIGSKERVTVFYQVWDQPIMAAGPKSFVGEMIEICGGVNIIADTSLEYPQMSEEVILDRNPDVILAPSVHAAPITRRHFTDKPQWSTIKAVKSGRIHIIDGNLVSRFGPRIVEVLESMARLLYPRRFAADGNRTDSNSRRIDEEARP